MHQENTEIITKRNVIMNVKLLSIKFMFSPQF